jgi:prepilin-type N-terminal cleavage/methylation domain-containing protein
MSSPLIRGGRHAASAAFTLIELLTVIAIIGVLAAITFGVAKGVQERAAISQARVELATLSASLEGFKRQYGDYPQTGDLTAAGPDNAPAIGAIATTNAESALFNALAGKLGPRLDALSGGKVFLELAKFSLETTNLPVLSNSTEVANAFLDPWGRRYLYIYKGRAAPGTWKAASYVLYSTGPDGRPGISISAAGVETISNAADAADNIYANR